MVTRSQARKLLQGLHKGLATFRAPSASTAEAITLIVRLEEDDGSRVEEEVGSRVLEIGSRVEEDDGSRDLEVGSRVLEIGSRF